MSCRGYLISPEVLGLPEQLDRTTIEGKAVWAKLFQDLTAVIDSMVCVCSHPLHLEHQNMQHF